ncbi:hypothetical protein AOQ84DRAFT_381079 [Glonium stellatum]|uniref:Uncharacterized protein n=1 Tax=Glonium stellatum TaxID=574774 RepID=A0A8E2JP72_9PEZI|nr:hypothetical protein AOQ84DRAFT_381079 [Glonium stellatum]
MTKHMLEHGAYVNNYNDSIHLIPLAAKDEHMAVVESLLEHGTSDEHDILLQMLKARCRLNIILQFLHGNASERAAVQFIGGVGGRAYLEEITDKAQPNLRPAIPASSMPGSVCQIMAKMQARKRQRIGSVPSASEAFAAFGKTSQPYRNIWKEGVPAMRKLISGRLPHGLREIMSCLQVADAMRLAGSNRNIYGEDMAECSREEFVNDLTRWGSLLSQDEQSLFDEIISAVWEKGSDPLDSPFIPADLGDTLSYFQKLVANIISQAGISHEMWGLSEWQGYRLGSMQNYYRATTSVKALEDTERAPQIEVLHPTKLGPEIVEDWKEKHEPFPLCNSKQLSKIPPKVVMRT